MTYATCYEYAKGPQGWYSLGRQFTTADQCHGHKVPMFSRTDLNAQFEEVKACAPSGCLYCAPDLDAKKAPCGSERFGSAKALRAPDFKFAVGPEPEGKKVIPIVSAD